MEWSTIINLLIAFFAACSAHKSYKVSKQAFEFEKRIFNETLQLKKELN